MTIYKWSFNLKEMSVDQEINTTGVETENKHSREVDEYIVERYGNYFDQTNTTVLNWVEATRKKLKEFDYD